MIGLSAAAAVALMTALTTLRLFAGATLYDRMLCVSSIVMKTALMCAALAVALGRSDWLDVAFGLVLCVFVLNAAALKFFRARTFQAPLSVQENRP